MRALLGMVLGLGVAALAGCPSGETEDLFPSTSATSSSGAGSSSSTSTGSGGGGAGGTGGATSSSSGTGGGCAESADCPGFPGEPCAQIACIDGECSVVKPALGTPTVGPAGDCHAKVCDGAGATLDLVDVTDVPDDGSDCTIDACDQQGTPTFTPKGKGTACSTGGGAMCDGNGACVACIADADCGALPECSAFVCVSGACVVNMSPDGTQCGGHPIGCEFFDGDPFDCNQNECFHVNGTCNYGTCQGGTCAQ
jgi:hypothetical protein